MLPLIPAILLLLLQGSVGPDRLPRDARLPESWQALGRASLSNDAQAEAVLAQLLAYVSGHPTMFSAREAAIQPVPDRAEDGNGWVARPAGSVDSRLQDAFHHCRRSRDGPDSIA